MRNLTIQEAVTMQDVCNPDDCDCETCPIGKNVKWEITDGGVDLVASICSMILFLKDMLEEANKQ